VPRDLLGDLHHQHRADREVRSDEQVRVPDTLERREVGAARAHDAVHTRLEAQPRVVERGVRLGEVDDHVGVAERVLQRDAELRIDPRDERHVVRALDGVAHRLPHLAGGPGDGDVDQAATSSGFTASSARLKTSSSPPTAAADSRPGS
jgi:hypothetical protein